MYTCQIQCACGPADSELQHAAQSAGGHQRQRVLVAEPARRVSPTLDGTVRACVLVEAKSAGGSGLDKLNGPRTSQANVFKTVLGCCVKLLHSSQQQPGSKYASQLEVLPPFGLTMPSPRTVR